MRKYLYLAILPFLLRCASVQAPQGGPKDSEAPYLLKSTPANGQVNFAEKLIVLEYSENVAENELKQPFLSPLTSVTVIPQGKKIRIKPDSGWKANQTYELRLQKKIKDEREGNIAPDTSLLFSTGKEPDRIRIQIETEDLSGNTLKGKSTCLLHAPNGISYFSSGDGTIMQGGIKEGSYLCQVFQDKNENLKYEEEDGRLFNDSIRIDSSISIRIRPLPQQFKPIRFFHQRRGDTLQIESSKVFRADSTMLGKKIAENEDGTLFWIYPFQKNIVYQQQDSMGTAYSDTIVRSLTDSNRSLSSIALKRKTITEKSGNQLIISLVWNWKVLKHPAKIEVTRDSVWTEINSEKLESGIRLKIPLAKPGKLKIRFDSLSFYNKTGIRKDSVTITASDLDENGSISGMVNSNENNIVTEIIDQNKTVAAKLGRGNFKLNLKPGRYRIQVYADNNKDGRYTGGNKNLGRKAEPLYFYPEVIELKPGWDLENVKVSPVF